MSTFKLYDRVRLINSEHAPEGALEGMAGYVIETYGDGHYEVEFSEPTTGVTIAQLVLREDELRLWPEANS